LKKNLILITDYYFIINIEKLKKYLNKILISINNKVLKNNTFIEGIKEILEFKNKIYNLEVYLKELSFIFIKSKNTKNQKIEHHVKTILDEGINVVIEANAGAGKTTTLQHYSKFGNKSSIKVFIPLTKVINLIYKIEELNSYEKKKNAFLNAICTYFSSQSELVTFNMNNLIDLFNNKNSIFLFDGYDEISNIAPWIINIIEELIEKYKVIIAISSRPEYIKDLRKDFLFVKLLDFKKEQRDKFIDSWLINKPQIAKKLKEHIYEYKIEGLLNNPLSATIFCRLAEQDYPLPITEAEMYHYRLDLLLGEYDKHKQITRNQIPKYTLEKIVIKIGFIFHKHNKRSMSKDEILFYLEIEYKYKDKKELECILEELISPCNILFDEFNDSKYTFGHLRYQEYLVAKEFQNNRGREIELYITNSWWRGALILFSQLTDNINYLIEELIEKVIEEDIEIINKYFEVIKEMIEVRPDSKEKEALYKLLNYYKIDNYKESFRKIIKS
ncbi:NACHT domain-containing protein, partial [Arcobacter aquimarinus]